MAQKRFYTAAEVASLVGISKQTLLRYEKKGIIPRPRLNPINKWREYPSEYIVKVKKILGR
jgi:DNA-binding transcriptional MerR regulator